MARTLWKSGTGGYRNLLVWQKATDLAVDCYRASKKLPKSELYGLVSQIRRSASSVSANIAEGQARGVKGEVRQFLRIARGSLAELETHLILCERVELLDREDIEPMLEHADEVGRMLRGLEKSRNTH